jgi:hypothetical protein
VADPVPLRAQWPLGSSAGAAGACDVKTQLHGRRALEDRALSNECRISVWLDPSRAVGSPRSHPCAVRDHAHPVPSCGRARISGRQGSPKNRARYENEPDESRGGGLRVGASRANAANESRAHPRNRRCRFFAVSYRAGLGRDSSRGDTTFQPDFSIGGLWLLWRENLLDGPQIRAG